MFVVYVGRIIALLLCALLFAAHLFGLELPLSQCIRSIRAGPLVYPQPYMAPRHLDHRRYASVHSRPVFSRQKESAGASIPTGIPGTPFHMRRRTGRFKRESAFIRRFGNFAASQYRNMLSESRNLGSFQLSALPQRVLIQR
jgi:hypothetical protein